MTTNSGASWLSTQLAQLTLPLTHLCGCFEYSYVTEKIWSIDLKTKGKVYENIRMLQPCSSRVIHPRAGKGLKKSLSPTSCFWLVLFSHFSDKWTVVAQRCPRVFHEVVTNTEPNIWCTLYTLGRAHSFSSSLHECSNGGCLRNGGLIGRTNYC